MARLGRDGASRFRWKGHVVQETLTDTTDLPSAAQCGAICAVAGQVQRDMMGCVARYPDLFPESPFDATFYSTTALANTFAAPFLDAERLRMTNRITLWIFGMDRLIDHVAASRSEVDDVVRRCLAVIDGDGADPDDSLGQFLAEIYAEMAAAPAFTDLGTMWRDEVRRTLRTFAWEWDCKTAKTQDPGASLPTLDTYLEKSEFGFALVFVTHWIWSFGDRPIRDVSTLYDACYVVQQVIRLLNDIGSVERERKWGDLNALLLGVDPRQVDERLAALTERSFTMLTPLLAHDDHRPLALFLRRHIEFNAGYYPITDYQAAVR